MDKTYIKVKGHWKYYYRVVDKQGNVVDFLLCDKRDEAAARAFFDKAIKQNGQPEKVVIDKSGANASALRDLNFRLLLSGERLNQIAIRQNKYLNNIVEQSHRKVKGKMHQCLVWRSDVGARATLTGIERWSMIKQNQLNVPSYLSAWDTFYSLVA
jgi:transposase-like protein